MVSPLLFELCPSQGNTPDWVKMSESAWKKALRLGAKLEVYNPPGHDIGILIIYTINDPHIFHLQKKVVEFTNYSWGFRTI